MDLCDQGHQGKGTYSRVNEMAGEGVWCENRQLSGFLFQETV